MTYRLAPGHILQFHHLKKQLRAYKAKGGTFVEFGAGNGLITKVLMDEGWSGTSFDLSPTACENNAQLNLAYIQADTLKVRNEDFFSAQITQSVDLVISSHVIEHLEEDLVETYFHKAKELLKPNGRIFTFIPAEMSYWSIEDELMGHNRRYTRTMIQKLCTKAGLPLTYCCGLTYPLSNLLLPLSNRIVHKNEIHNINLTDDQKTFISGNRKSWFKTEYPNFFKYIINEVTLWPFILLQRLFKNNPRCMVLYFETTKIKH